MNIIALDIGGSKIEGILWQRGKIVSWRKIKTPRNKKKFLETTLGIIRELQSGDKIQGIGISLAGAIDAGSGLVVQSPNLRFLNGFNLQRAIEKYTRVKTRVLNDAKCFLLGEVHFGQAKGKKNVIGMIIGTGVGGAIYLNGKLITGQHGFAGEQGMTTFVINQKSYRVEDLISSHGFARLGVKHPFDYQNRAFAGDKKAIAIYNQIGKFLGVHLANLVEIFDPEMIIIGGGISRARHLLLSPALKEMAKHVVFPKKYWPVIKTSRLKNAGLLGAVSLFLK
ncbi:MAG: hypothetical protein A2846_02745 [Candidatus Doudnabacteria bacterium RIFCSPHIGHO2_01_FULL_49_9]|uniref:ROK family protein n=1 Tax=Candidatus Doudnabacteria bacterium RIFCSPHIGHO2_01_FULL_49_9 TaxID=1817827 RepID=A0A1F5P3X0_9BACT|nr:MAG: hypothetical protein A2846_02745 [Candidatus Doudnabacteria bacterium RIFCSPHIGHO2_01_FULL_49_9]